MKQPSKQQGWKILRKENQNHPLRTMRTLRPLKYKLPVDAVKKILLSRGNGKDQVEVDQLALMSAILIRKMMNWSLIILQQLAYAVNQNFFGRLWSIILEHVMALPAKDGMKLNANMTINSKP
ncbi:hypothetical protein Droror1_Dr00020696 [Drosera rotundifolia]